MKLLRAASAVLVFCLSSIASFAIIDPALQMQTGNPSSATANTSNHTHYLIQRAQFAMDYNDTTREPNWVAWDLTTADVGGSGRSSSFFQDTSLPAGFYQVLPTDYSGSGYDRGHMCPSADRTVDRANNDVVFLMSNMIPQSPDNNQGVWASFETECRTLASAGNEILIISGPSGFSGSTIASGVAIPGYTWKIALVVPLGSGTALSRITTSTRVIAIKIPNIAGVRSDPWTNYVTSIAQIEADTGYTFLSALDSTTRTALRLVVDGQSSAGTPSIVAQPVAQSAPVGGSATFSVTATGDAPLAYQWLKDDDEIAGATGSSFTLSNVQASDIATYTVVVSNNVGAVTSNGAVLVISGLPATITSQPVSRTVSAGASVSFSVTAGGSAPFTYQWRKGGVNLTDGSNVSGSATPTLTLSNVQSADVAGYDVVVTNATSSIASDVATLVVTAAAPSITSQPVNQQLAPGSTATFSVVAVGSAPLTYQWRKGGVAITGNASAATATLTLVSIGLGDVGNYDVVITNSVSSATSSTAALAITSATTTQIIYTGGTYSQDFDTLPTSGTYTFSGVGPFYAAAASASNLGVNASNMGGWSFAKFTGTGSNETFAVGTGSGNTGALYSFGATGSTDRALGGLLSGTVGSGWGATLVNNTGQTITQFTITYTGEQWRYGAGTVGNTDKILFEYRVGGTDILTGTFTAVAALDFSSPVNSATAVGTAGALNGNLAANRALRTATITGVTWAAGQTLVLRWRDNDVAGSDDGLAIDDFSFSTPITGPVGPAVANTSPASGATNAALNTAIAVTFDQAVNVSGSWFTINSATRGAISAAVSASADFKTYTLTPPTNFDFSDTVSVSVLATGVSSQSTGLHPAANYSFSFVTAAAVAPGITSQPVAQTVAAGGTASFTVAASGTAPFTYQWRKNSTPIAGNLTAAAATLVITNAQAADIASYDVVVSNGVGSPVTSAAVALSVTPAAPTITTAPVAQTVTAGDTVTFTVAATGTAPFTYQWRKGGVALSNGSGVAGVDTATLTLTAVGAAAAGSYDVVVSNGVSPSATSAAVTLGVIVPPSQINYAGGTYAQNFDTLPSTGTFTFSGVGPFSLDAVQPSGVGATGAVGWSFAKSTGTGANALFRFDNGASNSGSAVSYGTTGATDRALGALASGTFAGRIGVTLVNTTSQTINTVTINYTGEQWRHGGSTTPNKLTFSYAVGASDINTGTFSNATALDFTAPIATTTTSALDGNVAANRVANINGTLTGLSWAPGQTLVLRWTDVDDTGSDDGLAIDDVTITDALPLPTITTQPIAQTVPAFSPASFTVAASSSSALSYQWRKNGTVITGNASATTATLTIASATTADIGSYDCVVSNTFGNATSDAVALLVTKVPAAIALTDLSVVYDGMPHGATATTTPTGLSVTLTYDNAATVPTNAGSYAVVATVVDANYFGSTTGTLVIAKAPAAIALADLAQVYTGAGHVATATTTPTGLAVALTYDGVATAPVNAGSYSVAAEITDANYTGSATDTLVIAKAAAPVAFSVLTATYDGAPHAATATTTPVGLGLVFTYNGSATVPANAGSYAVTATVADTNYFGSAAATFTIAKAPALIALGGLTATYDGTAKAATATTTPAALAVTFTYNGGATIPTNAGSYTVAATINDANYAGSTTGTLTIGKATATIALGALSAVYDGSAKVVTATTTPVGLAVGLTYDGSATAPVNAGSYAIVATVNDANYTGTASDTLAVAKALATVTLGGLHQTYDGSPKSVTTSTTPAGLTVSVTYNGVSTAPTAPSSYAVVALVNSTNYAGSATSTLVIDSAPVTIALSDLTQFYTGTPRAVTVTTSPASIPVTVTYNGASTAPTIPGSYAVVATANDANYTGSVTGTLVINATALVRHAPTLNGDIEGSAQVLLPEAITMNGGSLVSLDILVPGLPTVRLNGNPTFVGTRDGTGSATPSNYQVTLNGGSVLRYLVRRTDAITMPTVSAPPTPAGTRDVAINSASQTPGAFATLRNLTLNGNYTVAVPAGTYGNFTANGGAFVLGVAGATEPAVYNLQNLTINGSAQLTIVGPVVLTLANGIAFNGNAGATGHPEWLKLQVYNGGVTLNGSVTVNAYIVAPNGTVTLNSTLNGTLVADKLTINGSGLLKQP